MFKEDFNFDEWMQLYKDNPEEFEKKRLAVIKNVIDNSNDKQGLKKFQKGLDWSISTAENPMDACVKLSKRMAGMLNLLQDVNQGNFIYDLPPERNNLLNFKTKIEEEV